MNFRKFSMLLTLEYVLWFLWAWKLFYTTIFLLDYSGIAILQIVHPHTFNIES